MKKLFTILFAMFFVMSFVVSSCTKEEPEVQDEDDTTQTVLNEKSASDGSYSTEVYVSVIGDVLTKTDEAENSKFEDKSCPAVSLNPLVGYPKTLTIDYGDGCTDGEHTVKGKVVAEITNRIRLEGSEIIITFSDFQIDTVTVSGTIKMTVNSVNVTNSTVVFSVNFENCSMIMPKGTVAIDGSMTISWNYAEITNYTDDNIEITALSFTATNTDDKNFVVDLQENLFYPASCGYITKGVVNVQTDEAAYPATIDFGDGTCDNSAEVCTKIEYTVGTQTFYKDYCYTIELP